MGGIKNGGFVFVKLSDIIFAHFVSQRHICIFNNCAS